MMGASAFGPTRALLAGLAPAPGEGPDEEKIRTGFFAIELFASHPEDPKCRLIAQVTGDRDPGYGATSKMLVESAVCLAKDDLLGQAGFLTPAAAMGQTLITRLINNAGMGFSIR